MENTKKAKTSVVYNLFRESVNNIKDAEKSEKTL